MGVEAPGVSISVGGGPAVGGGVGVSVGPAVGTAGGEFGPSIGIGSTIVNEGPVAPVSLENTIPLTLDRFNPVGEIIFNPLKEGDAPSVIQQAEQVATAAWKAAEPVSVVEQAEEVAAKAWEAPLASSYNESRPRPVVTKAPEPARGLDVRVITNPFSVPEVETAPQSIVQKSVESRATTAVARGTFMPTQNQVQTEQIVEEEKVVKEDKKENQTQARKSEKQSVSKIKFTEAIRISKNRVAALWRAYQEVKAKGLSMKLLRAFLGQSYWEEKSPIAKQGYDGTLNLTVRELENQNNEYGDETKADQAISYAVANHIPVQEGEGGRLATLEEVREVLEGKEKEVLRSNSPAEMVAKRVVVKKDETLAGTGQVVSTLVEEKEEVTGEPTLKSLGLEEVFPKAA